jgi:hypothetical protein
VIDKGVVVLQNCMDLLKDVPGSYSDTCLTPHDGNQVIDIKVEEIIDIKEENPLSMTFPVIKAEHEVS